MSGRSKATWEAERLVWARALQQIARELGEDSDLYKILGTTAWGRYDGEPSVSELKDNIVFGCGYLQGVRYAAMNAGRTLGLEGTYELERIHGRIRG